MPAQLKYPLNEYELRCQGEDYDTASQVLLAIHSCLTRWGHVWLAIQMHERLQGHLADPLISAVSKVMLGDCYRETGQFPRAIDLQQEALVTFRQTGYRAGEAYSLDNLGSCHRQLGQIAQAIDLHGQALAISRQTGDRATEGATLSNLGACFRALGRLTQAIDVFEQALAISRQTGDRVIEGAALANLGICYRDLGQLPRAINLQDQALTASRETGSRRTESNILDNLANAYGDLGAWSHAAEYSRQAIDIADAISVVQVQSEARLSLVRIQLLAGDLQAAQQTVLAARDHPYPLFRAQVSLIAGITQLRQAQPAAAAREFRDAAAQADELLQQTEAAYEAQDTRALALCGLALTTHTDTSEAVAVFRAARAIINAEGIVKQVLALFDALAAADSGGILTGIRPSAAGKG